MFTSRKSTVLSLQKQRYQSVMQQLTKLNPMAHLWAQRCGVQPRWDVLEHVVALATEIHSIKNAHATCMTGHGSSKNLLAEDEAQWLNCYFEWLSQLSFRWIVAQPETEANKDFIQATKQSRPDRWEAYLADMELAKQEGLTKEEAKIGFGLPLHHLK